MANKLLMENCTRAMSLHGTSYYYNYVAARRQVPWSDVECEAS